MKFSGKLHSDFYFNKLIGKLTTFFHLQDFSLLNPTVISSTTDTPCSSPSHLTRKPLVYQLRLYL
jgi:hypothetical protein